MLFDLLAYLAFSFFFSCSLRSLAEVFSLSLYSIHSLGKSFLSAAAFYPISSALPIKSTAFLMISLTAGTASYKAVATFLILANPDVRVARFLPKLAIPFINYKPLNPALVKSSLRVSLNPAPYSTNS